MAMCVLGGIRCIMYVPQEPKGSRNPRGRHDGQAKEWRCLIYFISVCDNNGDGEFLVLSSTPALTAAVGSELKSWGWGWGWGIGSLLI